MPLASIQKINSLTSISGADKIERAKVLGWDCIVRKGEFTEGDLCVYIEPDTIIPKRFLDSDYDGDEKIRLKVIKMKKQISQGLVLNIDILNLRRKLIAYDHKYNWYIYLDGKTETKLVEGFDVTDLLEVEKYEKKIPEGTSAKGNFPFFIPKTDEINIQSEPELLEQLKGRSYYITQKIDGTSATYYKYKDNFGVCSRNLEIEDGENIYWKIARKYNIINWLPEGYAIQGEICGPGIQGNKPGLKEIELFIFNLWNIEKQIYEKRWDIPEILGREKLRLAEKNNIAFVTEIEIDSNFNYTLEKLLEKAKGNYANKTPQEGIVVRSVDQLISFKVHNIEFLLKYGE